MELSTDTYQELLACWKQQLALTQAEVLPHLPGSPNLHLAILCQPALAPPRRYFIKVTGNARAYAREQSALRVIAAQVDADMQPVAAGEIRQQYYWSAFRWIDCQPVQPTSAAEYREIGQALGRLHQATPAAFPGLRTLSLGSSLRQEIEDLRGVCAELGHHLARAADRLQDSASAWQAYEQTLPQVLLHRDFGWRNLVRKSGGSLMIVDYEHIALGPWYLDLTKCLDRELACPQHLQWLLEGYAQVTGSVCGNTPTTYVRGVRLWGAARFFFHGCTHHDASSLAHGTTIMQRLATEWSNEVRDA